MTKFLSAHAQGVVVVQELKTVMETATRTITAMLLRVVQALTRGRTRRSNV